MVEQQDVGIVVRQKVGKHVRDSTEIRKLNHACFEISHHFPCCQICDTPTSRNYQLYDTSLPGSKKQTSSYTLLKQKGCF